MRLWFVVALVGCHSHAPADLSDAAAVPQGDGAVADAQPAGGRTPLDPEALAKAAGTLAIDDETGVMSAFYERLAKTIHGDAKAVTRVLHYGDSLIAGDLIAGAMRRKMQQRFGDAGHGFIFIAKPWEWYYQNDVGYRASDGWTMNRITGPFVGDGFYGLGGVSFHTREVQTAGFNTMAIGDYGKKVSRFDVYYLEQPSGGDFQMQVRGQAPVRVSTRGEAKVSRKATLEVPDGEASMTVRTLGGGDVRMFGVAMERDVSGVTYDSLGTLGGRASLWEVMNADHWKDQMTLRDPALVIVQYGTNESEFGVNDDKYRKSLGDLIDTLRAAAPGASVLVASPLDRAEKDSSGELRTMKVIERIVDLQRDVAKEHHVAFFCTYCAMGGKGSMAQWVKRGLANRDMTHPGTVASNMVADWLFESLVTGYESWASKHPDAPTLPR